jgi:hypothetical protein
MEDNEPELLKKRERFFLSALGLLYAWLFYAWVVYCLWNVFSLMGEYLASGFVILCVVLWGVLFCGWIYIIDENAPELVPWVDYYFEKVHGGGS